MLTKVFGSAALRLQVSLSVVLSLTDAGGGGGGGKCGRTPTLGLLHTFVLQIVLQGKLRLPHS